MKTPAQLRITTKSVEMHDRFANSMKGRIIEKIAGLEFAVISTSRDNLGVTAHFSEVTRTDQKWTGEGRPPVGTKVTIETNGLRIWKEAEVFIGRTSKVVAAFKLIESDMVVVYLEEENACCVFRASMCRIPKTPEQLKAESDARATSVLTGELEHLVLASERLGPSELAEKLIRLNYRKQPTDQ